MSAVGVAMVSRARVRRTAPTGPTLSLARSPTGWRCCGPRDSRVRSRTRFDVLQDRHQATRRWPRTARDDRRSHVASREGRRAGPEGDFESALPLPQKWPTLWPGPQGGVSSVALRGRKSQGRQSCLLAHAVSAGLFPNWIDAQWGGNLRLTTD